VPPVSVGLTVTDDDPLLSSVVASVFSQTWDGEIRLVTAVTGQPPATLERLAAELPIEVVDVTDRAEGALASVLDDAEGPVGWVTPASLWHPRKLELQLPRLSDGDSRVCVAPWRSTNLGAGSFEVERPQLSLDPLEDLLAGRLRVPLPALLADAEAVRAAGGVHTAAHLDPGVDLLVRLATAGAEIVSTGDPTPLCTRVDASAPSALANARARKALLAHHRDAYHRYGRRFARSVLIDVLEEAARGHEQDGHGLRAAMARGRAGGLRFVDAQVRRPVVGRMVKAVKETVPSGRPPGGAPDPAPSAGGPKREGAADGATAVARAALQGGRPEEAIEALGDGGAGDAEHWLLLEEAHRARLDPHAAQRALEDGQRAHPTDPDLLVRRVEQACALGRWEECIRLWEALSVPRSHLTMQVYWRVASALRMLEEHERALAVAEEGLRRWPGERKLETEQYRARAALVDWYQAIAAPAPSPAAERLADAPGEVTDPGFLWGRPAPLRGVLRISTAAAPTVRLEVNGSAVARTHASPVPDADATHAFSLDCRDLLHYLGDGDVVSVTCDGAPLPIPEVGPRAVVVPGYASRTRLLRSRLRSGWVFSKFGRLRRGYSKQDKDQILSFFEEISDLIEDHLGHGAHPFFGNLLGAVRDHDFIGHDVGGFDMGYISRCREPEEVRAEFLDVCRMFIDRGLQVTVNPWCAMIRRGAQDRTFMDVNFAWFTPEDELQFSYGWRHTPVHDTAATFAPRLTPMAGRLVPVPGNAEAVLGQLYGPGWMVPDQGFDISVELQRNTAYLLSAEELDRLAALAPERVTVEAVITEDGELAFRDS
jgi:hypothetical protein